MVLNTCRKLSHLFKIDFQLAGSNTNNLLCRTPCRRLRYAMLCLAFLTLPITSYSQGTLSDAERRYQQAFDAMRADLANPERSFEFVQAAIAAGDQRGAIAALERILQINPSLANIQALWYSPECKTIVLSTAYVNISMF